MRLRKRKWVEPYLLNDKEYLIEDGKELTGPLFLEIGMGMGDFLIASSKNDPEINYVGLEKDPTCVARAIVNAKKAGAVFKIMRKNASQLPELFKTESVDRIYLHFSDPWPKKAHHKRRLTYPSFLALYEQVLKPGGEIIFKTDNHDLFYDSLEYVKESAFVIEEIDDDYHRIRRLEPLTAYESRFVSLGQPIYFLRLAKPINKV